MKTCEVLDLTRGKFVYYLSRVVSVGNSIR